MQNSPLDPLVTLATGMHANPGVYALLLGSGVSSGAGIPTAWGAVQELVRRVAAAQDPDASDAEADPEAWWDKHGDGQRLGYSNLLEACAPTPAARRSLIARFFEPSEEDSQAGLKVPGPAHRAIASLVKRGVVRVILTTNFDRLIERALEEAGCPPQVLTRAEYAENLTPLAHAPVTLIKLHGDYADLGIRNTAEELDSYPPELDALLDRILDEYGLLICGWSADWDTALVAALRRAKARRYPLYWDSRSAKGEAARDVLAQHRGLVVTAASADELFTELLARVDALDRLAEPPITTAIAVTRLKRYLADPTKRVDVYDLVAGVVDKVVARTSARPLYLQATDVAEAFQGLFGELLADVSPTLHLLVAGVYHDRDRTHSDAWVEAVQRLMLARTDVTGQLDPRVEAARHYPALLALRAAGITSVITGRDDVLIRLLTQPSWRDRHNSSGGRRPGLTSRLRSPRHRRRQ